jgi:hypothetical protein
MADRNHRFSLTIPIEIPSGFRISPGIIGIVLGAILLMPAIAGFGEGNVVFMAFLILAATLGNITAGIVLLTRR